MDEVAFHVNQRLEIIQIWLSEVIQKSRDFVENSIRENLASENAQAIREATKQLFAKLHESWRGALDKAIVLLDPKVIFTSISSLVGHDLNRATIYACCFGFTVGSSLGLAVGICLQAPSRPIPLMRAIAATSFNGPDGIAILDDIPVPLLKTDSDVIVEVKFATLCQTDLMVSGGYARRMRSILDSCVEPPVILGRSGSGTVMDVGAKVKGLDLGDKVIFWCPVWKRGCLTDLALLASWQVAPLPNGMSMEEGAWFAYSCVHAWKALSDIGAVTKDLHRKRAFVHCGSNLFGETMRRLLRCYGTNVSATSHSPLLDSNNYFPLSSAPSLLCDPNHSYKYDYVFNTEGEPAEEFCRGLCCDNGKMVRCYPPKLHSDTFGTFLGFLYSFWLRATHRPRWEAMALSNCSRLPRFSVSPPSPVSPHALDPPLVAMSSLGAVLVAMGEPTTRRKRMDTIKR